MPPLPRPHLLATALQLGHLLKTARKRLKLTQAQLSPRLCLSQNRISHLEQHADEISFKQLMVWSAIVGLELHLGEREEPKSTSAW